MKRKRLQDLPIWRGDFEPGETAVWIWHNEDLSWNLRYSAQKLLLNFALNHRERYIEQLIRAGWMIHDEKGLRSVIPGKSRGGRNGSN